MAKSHLFLAGFALAAHLALPAWAEGASAATVVATVNGTEITLGHMIAAREALPEEYKSLPNDTLFSGILDQLVQQTALMQSLGDTLSTRQNLQIENNRRDYLSNAALAAVVENAVTDAALQAAYDARFAAETALKQYSAAHILVADEAKAKELLTQLEGGADFAELAKANSTDTGSGANGGDLGWFGLGAMVKPFEEAVVSAEIGKVVGPVQSEFGFHLILVKETRIAEKPALEELREELSAEIQQKAIEEAIKSVTEAATVERKVEGIDPALLSDLTLLDK